MASSVTAPLERQFGQVPGLSQMTSTSSLGSSIITLQFNLEREHRRRGAAGAGGDQCRRQRILPRDLPNPPIYSKVNPADSPILTLALTSDTLPLVESGGSGGHALAQKISQLPGVGLVSISGGQKPAVRIQANPTALASYGSESGRHAHRAGAGQRQPGQGQLDGPRQSFTIGANDQLISSSAIQQRQSSPTATARRSGCPMSPP